MDALIRSLIKQADALEEQATALGMQAATLKRTVQAMLASATAEPKTEAPVVQRPPAVRYFNQAPPSATPTA